MDITGLADLLASRHPVATVVVDVSIGDEAGAQEVDLRWGDLSAQLEQAGARPVNVTALAKAATHPDGVHGPVTRLIAARDGQVILDEVMFEGSRDGVGTAAVGPVPDVVPLLRYRARHAAVVVARVDREGSDIEVVSAVGGPRGESTSVHGSHLYLHPGGTGGWRSPQDHPSTPESRRVNADASAAEVSAIAHRSHAVAVLVAGDVHIRRRLVDDLALAIPVVEVDVDARSSGASQVAVETSLAQSLEERAAHAQDDALARWRAVHGDPATRDRSTSTLVDTLGALQAGQVEELLVVPAVLRQRVLAIGPQGADVALLDSGVAWGDEAIPAPADLALLRAAAATGAQVQLVELEELNSPDLLDGVGARLRWSSSPN